MAAPPDSTGASHRSGSDRASPTSPRMRRWGGALRLRVLALATTLLGSDAPARLTACTVMFSRMEPSGSGVVPPSAPMVNCGSTPAVWHSTGPAPLVGTE